MGKRGKFLALGLVSLVLMLSGCASTTTVTPIVEKDWNLEERNNINLFLEQGSENVGDIASIGFMNSEAGQESSANAVVRTNKNPQKAVTIAKKNFDNTDLVSLGQESCEIVNEKNSLTNSGNTVCDGAITIKASRDGLVFIKIPLALVRKSL